MNSKRIGIVIIIVLLVGVILAVFLSQRQSNIKQQASGQLNINKGSTISSTANQDGTMGPLTPANNYSNGLNADKTGSLTVFITDPPQTDSKPALPTRIPTLSKSGKVSASPTNAVSDGTQNVKSLIVQIKKAEVHLNSPDKWETLKMDVPISADLVQLKNGIVALLGVTKLSEGAYSEIRLYIANATAVLPDNSVQNLNFSGKDWIVKVDESFSIDPKKNTTLVIDFDAQKSVNYEDGKFNLKPFVSKITETK